MRNVNTYYFTKNYKNQATDRRQDQEPITNTTNETTNSGEHPPNPLSKPPNLQLQTTEDKQHPNPTTTMDHKKKTSIRKKDVAIQVLTATLQLGDKEWTRCYMSHYSFDNTKTMESSTREQSEAQCQNINSDEFYQPTQPHS